MPIFIDLLMKKSKFARIETKEQRRCFESLIESVCKEICGEDEKIEIIWRVFERSNNSPGLIVTIKSEVLTSKEINNLYKCSVALFSSCDLLEVCLLKEFRLFVMELFPLNREKIRRGDFLMQYIK